MPHSPGTWRLTAQADLSDCGPACLAVVLARWGCHVPLAELREATGGGRDGVTALDLARVARGYGLRSRGVRVAPDDLGTLPPASILHWEGHHFVVLKRTHREHVTIVDPLYGEQRLRAADAAERFSGVALTFEPTDAFQRRKPARRASRFVRLLGLRPRNVAGIVSASIVIRLLTAVAAVLTGAVVDRVVPGNRWGLLGTFAWILTASGALLGTASLLRARALVTLRTRADRRLAQAFTTRVTELPLPWIQRHAAGDLLTRLRSTGTVRDVLATSTLAALLDGIFVVVFVVALLVLFPVIGAVVAVFALFQVAVLRTLQTRVGRRAAEAVARQTASQSYAFQLFKNIGALQAAGHETLAADRFFTLYDDELDASARRARLTAVSESILATVQTLAPTAVLMVAVAMVMRGSASLGSAIAASTLAGLTLGPIGSLVSAAAGLQVVGSYIDKLDDVLATEPPPRGSVVLPEGDWTIELSDVTFRYGPGQALLDRVSLSTVPGEMLVVTGGSGVGKSTLLRLMLGLLDAAEGAVTICGVPVRDLDLPAVRRQMGVVSQDPYLFGGSLLENVTFGVPAYERHEVREACELACIRADVEAMPLGLDTIVNDAGDGLSGGQRQRIALARALLQRPRMLLLDEATSQLDLETETRVMRNLRGLGITIVVVTHRPSVLAQADRVVLLEHGSVTVRDLRVSSAAGEAGSLALASEDAP